MNGRICLSVEQAFDAGFAEPCEHLVPDPNECPKCCLTKAEIRRFAVLLRSDNAPEAGVHTTAA